jgi:trehalose 6-phosphate synthase
MKVSGNRECASLFVLANRLPIEFHAQSGWRPSPGGLVNILDTVLCAQDAVWIGCGGRFLGDASTNVYTVPPKDINGVILEEILITELEYAGYYKNFSNRAVWPLYHDAIVDSMYSQADYSAYESVNQKFANRVAELAPPRADIWVHDYHLQLVPAMLRRLRPDLNIGFFLHIPFPPADLFHQLPWSRQILQGLLGSDLIGFQTTEAATRFCTQAVSGFQLQSAGDCLYVETQQETRTVRVSAFPIGVDAHQLAAVAQDEETILGAAEFRRSIGDPDLLILGVDRLDYTKGIDVRIEAIAELLQSCTLDRKSTVFFQAAMPTRDNLFEYQELRRKVEAKVDCINVALGAKGSAGIQYICESLSRKKLIELYVSADIMLVTPLCDGMNLVCKEYVACRPSGSGALVLSEFAGAARSLQSAWLVNPYCVESVKEGIVSAVTASAEENRRRMCLLQEDVFKNDAMKWANDFVHSLRSLK